MPHLLFFGRVGYTGVILTLTSGNGNMIYDRNFDFILKILWRNYFSYLFEKDKLINLRWPLGIKKNFKLEFNKKGCSIIFLN